MLQITLTINDTDRILCYTDTEATARTIVYDRGAVTLESDGTATVRALNGRLVIGTWRADPAPAKPGSVLVTWIGPDADASALIPEASLDTWLAARIEPLLEAHPDLLGFAGVLGDFISRGPTKTVRQALAGWAADTIAATLLAGDQVTLGGNLLAVTRA